MPPLDNLNFRKALAHSIDRDTMCQQVLNGTYVAGYSMLPPGFPAYNPDLKQYQVYDMEQAKKYLADFWRGSEERHHRVVHERTRSVAGVRSAAVADEFRDQGQSHLVGRCHMGRETS